MPAKTNWRAIAEREHGMNLYDILTIAISQSLHTKQSVPELAAELGCSPSAINYYLRKFRLNWPKHNGRPSQRKATAEANRKRATITATIDGKTQSIAQWCKELGNVSYDTARQRVTRSGWSPERSVTEPKETQDQRKKVIAHARGFSKREKIREAHEKAMRRHM